MEDVGLQPEGVMMHEADIPLEETYEPSPVVENIEAQERVSGVVEGLEIDDTSMTNKLDDEVVEEVSAESALNLSEERDTHSIGKGIRWCV